MPCISIRLISVPVAADVSLGSAIRSRAAISGFTFACRLYSSEDLMASMNDWADAPRSWPANNGAIRSACKRCLPMRNSSAVSTRCSLVAFSPKSCWTPGYCAMSSSYVLILSTSLRALAGSKPGPAIALSWSLALLSLSLIALASAMRSIGTPTSANSSAACLRAVSIPERWPSSFSSSVMSPLAAASDSFCCWSSSARVRL